MGQKKNTNVGIKGSFEHLMVCVVVSKCFENAR